MNNDLESEFLFCNTNYLPKSIKRYVTLSVRPSTYENAFSTSLLYLLTGLK